MSIIVRNIRVPIAFHSLAFQFRAVLLPGRNANPVAQMIEPPQPKPLPLLPHIPALIGLDAAGRPVRSDCDRAAQSMVMVKINLT
jgi:hypothetical protein